MIIGDNSASKDVKVRAAFKFKTVISKTFSCPKCNIFCRENLVVLKATVAREMLRTGASIPQPVIYCQHGCHLNRGWEPITFNWGTIDEETISAWPEEWKKNEEEVRKKL